MIKAIIFDLDGVLADLKELHFLALNQALAEVNPKYIISIDKHLNELDGLPTKIKLAKIDLPLIHWHEVKKRKQQITISLLKKTVFFHKKDLLSTLSVDYSLFCCSNSVRETIETVLHRMEVYQYFYRIYSNQDILNAKPHPEIYLRTMVDNGFRPKEILVIEDSPVGVQAAIDSGAHVLTVKNSKEVTYENIKRELDRLNSIEHKTPWIDNKLNIVVPMAGKGSRFAEKGYTFPKPLIEIPNLGNKTMIQAVVDNINIKANYIFLCQKEHIERYNLNHLLTLISPGCKVVSVNGVTAGAASTLLLASQYINNDSPLLIANSDQIVEWNSSDFMYNMSNKDADGGILTFKATHPKWSYVRIESGSVTQVAEKQPISDDANVGIYYFKHGKDCVKAIEDMISQNIRTNGEFYIAPCYNEMIKERKRILPYQVEKMWGIGTPEDLEYFIKNYK